MADRVRLRDGTDAIIWPLLPTDGRALKELYEHLSPASRYHRFMSGVPHLTEPMLHKLVDLVDGVDHIALVLFVLPDDGPDAPAGIARIARYPDEPEAADVAVTVVDEWQGHGVATALLEALAAQRPRGVTRIVTEVTVDNAASLAMLERLGTAQVTAAGNGCLDVVVELAGADADGEAHAAEVESGPKARTSVSTRRLRRRGTLLR